MNSLIVFVTFLVAANASVLPLAPLSATTVLEGPSSSASVIGPDGSAIVAANPGGRIVASENLGLAPVGYSAPLVAASVAPVAPIGPIARIAVAPVLAKTLVASPLTASGYPLFAPGSGLEGQWIPDINEKLYDDGSYKEEIN